MLRKLRRRLTYANMVSTLCLFLVVAGGTAWAADTVFSTDIVDGEVKTPDLANGAVTSNRLATNSVTSRQGRPRRPGRRGLGARLGGRERDRLRIGHRGPRRGVKPHGR